jgi:hypothetical protein
MAGTSPLYRISAMQLMSAITIEATTLNNHLGFERDLWQHQVRSFAGVPKTTVSRTTHQLLFFGTVFRFGLVRATVATLEYF